MRPGVPSDHGVPFILIIISGCMKPKSSKDTLKAMPVNGSVEGHVVLDRYLFTGWSAINHLKLDEVATSTSSFSSKVKAGPGNCPLTLMIFLVAPLGEPGDHVMVRCRFTCLVSEIGSSRYAKATKESESASIFAAG